MSPVCLTTPTAIVAGTTSAGGLTALAVKCCRLRCGRTLYGPNGRDDVSLVVVSRTPLAEIEPFKGSQLIIYHFMFGPGWGEGWVEAFSLRSSTRVSSHGTDFNYDYHVSFTPEEMARGRGFYNFEEDEIDIEEISATSVFVRNGQGEIFHTYSAYARGDEQLLLTYHYLELTPKGRNEPGPRGNLSDWVRHHDRYGAGGTVAATGRYEPAETTACGCGER
jgi:predicted dithiol-disulfide oxidoreductase (DUF899 family)